MITKKQVIKTINELPNSFSVEEVIDKILLLQKIDIGMEQSAKEEVYTTTEAKHKLKKWLK